MRPWILVCLCFLGLGGGACSARPLLDISLTSGDGIALTGYPRIDVTGKNGQLIKQIDKTDGGDNSSILILENDAPLSIGVYLPSGTDDDVTVSAELHAVAGNCDLAGTSTTVAHVQGGDETSVSVILHKKQGDCSSPNVDAGTDGAHDVHADVVATNDGEVGGDADGPTIGDCFAYCALYLAECPNNADAPSYDCVPKCMEASWPGGSPNDVAGQNTLSCRVRHLRAGANPPLDCSECSAGSPDSPGVCGSPIDAGTRDACPLSP